MNVGELERALFEAFPARDAELGLPGAAGQNRSGAER